MEGRRQDHEDGRQVGFRRHKEIRLVTDRGGAGSKIRFGEGRFVSSLWLASFPVSLLASWSITVLITTKHKISFPGINIIGYHWHNDAKYPNT